MDNPKDHPLVGQWVQLAWLPDLVPVLTPCLLVGWSKPRPLSDGLVFGRLHIMDGTGSLITLLVGSRDLTWWTNSRGQNKVPVRYMWAEDANSTGTQGFLQRWSDTW